MAKLKKNQMTRLAFWSEIALLTVIFDIIYFFWGFRNCLFLDRVGSVIFFVLLDLALVLCLGTILSIKYKNNLSIWCTVLFPIEVYTVLAYLTSQGWRIILLVAVWILAMILFMLLKSHVAISRGKEFRLNSRFIPTLIRVGWMMSVAVYLLLLIPILSRGARGIEVSLDYTILNTTKGLTITGQQTNLMKFDEATWKKLEPEQKEELLQLVANIERNELGLPYELYIGFRDMSTTEVYAAYTAADHKILIDEEMYLTGSGEDLIRLICHQAFHAYERSLVDMYIDSDRSYHNMLAFKNVESYIAELQLNVQAIDDRIPAMRDRMEADALAYAENKTAEYLYWIDFAINSKK